jgi:hypothetical protein
MKRKWLAIGIILLFVGTCIIPAIAQETEKTQSTSKGNWLYVGGSGPGNYTRIYYALLNAHDGDTIFVYNGFYHESVFIEMELTLIGEDKNNTIIEGAIRNVANHVTITGFTVQNDSGILINTRDVLNPSPVQYVSIHNMIVKDNIYGLKLYTVDACEFHDNILMKNKESGIWIIGHTGHNSFHNNTITNNPIGIYFHIVESGTNIFEYNDIRTNEVGIELYFKYSVDAINIFQSNNFIKNKRAVRSFSSMKLSDVMSNPSMLQPQETWDANYWDAWKIPLPRPICSLTSFYLKAPDTTSSTINTRIIPMVTPRDFLDGERLDFGRFPSIYFDRNPAQEPYDILGMSG